MVKGLKKFVAQATQETKYKGTLERTLSVESTDLVAAGMLMASKFKGWKVGKVKEVEKFDFEVEVIN